jgi:hypothetical protein
MGLSVSPRRFLDRLYLLQAHFPRDGRNGLDDLLRASDVSNSTTGIDLVAGGGPAEF